MRKPRVSTSEQGSAFETEVAHLLRLMGYQVSRNHLLTGTQTDLLATKPDRLSNVALIVECTDRANPVGVPLVKEKSAILLSYTDSRYIFRLLFVSRSGFTAEARAYAAANAQILLMTPDDLERELVDFTPYADWYRSAYESSTGFFDEGKLFGNYVELTAEDDHHAIIPSLSDYVLQWLHNDREQLLFILGEFGSGKTSFCRHFVYETLVRRSRADRGPTPPLPLLINLREFRGGSLNLPQVISATLINTYGVVVRSRLAIERLASTGRLILVLDGFDEMADKADRKTLVECLGQIHLLAALHTKIILTCRSNFFQSHADIVDLFRQISVELPAIDESRPAVRISLDRRGRTLHIARLNPQQIEQYVRNRTGDEADSILHKMRSVHDLTDLSTRPVLLDMIVSTIPQLADQNRVINSSALYEHYTDRWTSRDEWRVVMPLEVRREFCDALAWHMRRATREEIDFSVLEALMTTALETVAGSAEELERFKNDIQTCSFLSRSGTGSTFRFAHKSFLEFFIARAIIERIIRNLPAPVDSREQARRTRQAERARQELETLEREERERQSRERESPRTEDEDGLFHGLFVGGPHYVLGGTGGGHRLLGWKAYFDRFFVHVRELPDFSRTLRSPQVKPSVSREVALAEHLRSRMRELFRERWPGAGDDLEVSTEIATFAVEYASNQGYALAELLSATTDTELLTILGDILVAAPDTSAIRAEAESLKRAVRDVQSSWNGTLLGAALARIPDVLDAGLLQEMREHLPPAGWTYCLFLIARDTSEHTRELLSACLSIDGLSTIDRFLCSRAVYGIDASVLEALAASDQESEQMLVIQVCVEEAIEQKTAIRLLAGLLRRSKFSAVKAAADQAVRNVTSKEAWLMLRTLAHSERDPAMRRQLLEAEQEARNAASRARNRPARPRERRQFLDLLWSRLR